MLLLFDDIDKVLIVLRSTSSRVSIFSFANIVGAPVEIATEIFTSIFSLATKIVKKLVNITKNEKKA